jgi:hypothetical protein
MADQVQGQRTTANVAPEQRGDLYDRLRTRGRRRRRRRRGRRRGRKFIAEAIKRPGALTAKKRAGESTAGAAQRMARSGSTLSKQQANFYLNVLRPATQRRRRG